VGGQETIELMSLLMKMKLLNQLPYKIRYHNGVSSFGHLSGPACTYITNFIMELKVITNKHLISSN